jgi:hypothetical protein
MILVQHGLYAGIYAHAENKVIHEFFDGYLVE